MDSMSLFSPLRKSKIKFHLTASMKNTSERIRGSKCFKMCVFSLENVSFTIFILNFPVDLEVVGTQLLQKCACMYLNLLSSAGLISNSFSM